VGEIAYQIPQTASPPFQARLPRSVCGFFRRLSNLVSLPAPFRVETIRKIQKHFRVTAGCRNAHTRLPACRGKSRLQQSLPIDSVIIDKQNLCIGSTVFLGTRQDLRGRTQIVFGDLDCDTIRHTRQAEGMFGKPAIGFGDPQFNLVGLDTLSKKTLQGLPDHREAWGYGREGDDCLHYAASLCSPWDRYKSWPRPQTRDQI